MRKLLAVLVLLAMFALPVYAIDYHVPTDARRTTTSDFEIIEFQSNDWFSIVSEDSRAIIIDVREDTLVYFEDFTPIHGILDYGQSIKDVLKGREITLTYVRIHASPESPVRLPPGFYRAISVKVSGGVETNHSATYVNDEIRVYLDGERLGFDVPPQIIDGRTMVPMRVIFEAFGAEVEWFDEGNQSITATLRSDGADEVTVVYLYIGEDYMYVAEKTEHEFYVAGSGIYLSYFVPILEERIEIDVPPQIVNGRTLIPLRAVSEVFGAQVAWNEDTHTVRIRTMINNSSHFTPHYFMHFDRLNRFLNSIDDDFFSENYLVFFNIEQSHQALDYYVLDVRENGNIVLSRIQRTDDYGVEAAESNWRIVIILERQFSPESFRVILSRGSNPWWLPENLPITVIQDTASLFELMS